MRRRWNNGGTNNAGGKEDVLQVLIVLLKSVLTLEFQLEILFPARIKREINSAVK
jgi:hypothetical protein